MSNLIFKRESTLGAGAVGEVHFVGPLTSPNGINYSEVYIFDNSNTPHLLSNVSHTEELIDAKIAALSMTEVVADITARDALTPTTGQFVHVVDASADATVDSGRATYLWDGSAWIKDSEAESLDIDFSTIAIAWSQLTGGPTSTPAQIDQTVTDSHTHANKTELDKIGEDGSGCITYDGTPVVTWTTQAW